MRRILVGSSSNNCIMQLLFSNIARPSVYEVVVFFVNVAATDLTADFISGIHKAETKCSFIYTCR